MKKHCQEKSTDISNTTASTATEEQVKNLPVSSVPTREDLSSYGIQDQIEVAFESNSWSLTNGATIRDKFSSKFIHKKQSQLKNQLLRPRDESSPGSHVPTPQHQDQPRLNESTRRIPKRKEFI